MIQFVAKYRPRAVRHHFGPVAIRSLTIPLPMQTNAEDVGNVDDVGESSLNIYLAVRQVDSFPDISFGFWNLMFPELLHRSGHDQQRTVAKRETH